MTTLLSARCPACQTTIRFTSTPELGAFLVCEECEAEVEVIQVRPLKLSWVDEDDFDDYEEVEGEEDFDDLDLDFDDGDDDF
jgi:lysine biosynthesis protein LysW